MKLFKISHIKEGKPLGFISQARDTGCALAKPTSPRTINTTVRYLGEYPHSKEEAIPVLYDADVFTPKFIYDIEAKQTYAYIEFYKEEGWDSPIEFLNTPMNVIESLIEEELGDPENRFEDGCLNKRKLYRKFIEGEKYPKDIVTLEYVFEQLKKRIDRLLTSRNKA